MGAQGGAGGGGAVPGSPAMAGAGGVNGGGRPQMDPRMMQMIGQALAARQGGGVGAGIGMGGPGMPPPPAGAAGPGAIPPAAGGLGPMRQAQSLDAMAPSRALPAQMDMMGRADRSALAQPGAVQQALQAFQNRQAQMPRRLPQAPPMPSPQPGSPV